MQLYDTISRYMVERPRPPCIPPRTLGDRMRGGRTGLTPIPDTHKGPPGRTLGLSVGGIQRPQPGSGDSGSPDKMWKSFPAKQKNGVPPIDLEPWTDIVENYDGNGNTGFFLKIPGINLPDGTFDKLVGPDDKEASYSSPVKTNDGDGEVSLTISFSPEIAQWRYGLWGGQIHLPPELGALPKVLPDEVSSNNGLIVASFNPPLPAVMHGE